MKTKLAKRFKKAVSEVDRAKTYELPEAVKLVKKTATAKFDESIDIAVKLGVDPKKSDQMVRGTVTLPHGTGKDVRVLVLCKPPKDEEAKAAGADYVGFEEYIEKIQNGWTDIDVVIATPDVMGQVGKLGRILGTRGLMPNPKSGTVTMNVAEAVREVKAGRISVRVDKGGVLHGIVGKASFDEDKLVENVESFIASINRMRPPAVKGNFIKSVTLSSTMGPGVRVDLASLAGLR
ncbi:MAG: 50S ribosomal protein L1 [Chlorobi bacterium]|nr:50S ribosomal protein L1 [Chlorobiota bacterium]